MTNDTQKLVDKYNKSVQSIQEQELAIDKVKQKLDRLSLYKNSGVILTDSELAELDNLPRKLDLMNSKLNDTKLNTSELGKFKIKKEEASSAGVRRIKAILE